MRGGKFVECNEDRSKKEGGLSFTGAPSNVGGGHYEQLIKSQHPSVGSRKQNSCNGWTEVEYWTGDTWEPTGNLRSPVATITEESTSSSSSSSENVADSTMDTTSVVGVRVTHGVTVEDGNELHYIWIDLFRDLAGEAWLDNHIEIKKMRQI